MFDAKEKPYLKCVESCLGIHPVKRHENYFWILSWHYIGEGSSSPEIKIYELEV